MFGYDQGIPPERAQFQLVRRHYVDLSKKKTMLLYWNLYNSFTGERFYIPFPLREGVFSDRYGGWWSRRTNNFFLNDLSNLVIREDTWLQKHGNMISVSSQYIKDHKLTPKFLSTKEKELQSLKIRRYCGLDLYPPKEWTSTFLKQLRWEPLPKSSATSKVGDSQHLFGSVYPKGYRWLDLLFSIIPQASYSWLSTDLSDEFLEGTSFFSNFHIYTTVMHHEDLRAAVLRAEILRDLLDVIQSASVRDGVF